jgi:hypothetical protein
MRRKTSYTISSMCATLLAASILGVPGYSINGSNTG